ncbi:MAG: hypothetical protein ACQES5_10850 [Thermodesulfobacteriota bacterium]
MRCYMVDEVSPEDVGRIEQRLSEMGLQGGLPGIYKLPVPRNMLSDIRTEHFSECGPYYMALETDEGWIKLEFLVRSEEKIRCACVGYASPELRMHMINYMDGLLEELKVKT